MGLLLTPEQANKAFENAFEAPVTLDHKPTVEEIFTLELMAVAQDQLDKADPQGHYERGKKDEHDLILLQMVEWLGYEISKGRIVRITNETGFSCDVGDVCDASFDGFMGLVEQLLK